jgi:transposase InsO family protein
MAWQEHRRVDLIREFVLKASDDLANISELCREYGISRKTGYKWLKRYEAHGEAGLVDGSRRPKKMLSTSAEVVFRVNELRAEHRFWGPKKLRELLRREFGKRAPSVKTVQRILRRLGLPLMRPRLRQVKLVRQARVLNAARPNDVWTADFKGWWKTKDGRRFEPLTVRDAASRYILLCVHSRETVEAAMKHFTKLFTAYGLPKVIRVDNGPPFGVANAFGGLTRLSAWWVSLGIDVSFSRPATPSDNGAHERMHGDVALELQSEPSADVVTQQRVVDHWVQKFNYVRPHEALGMKAPAQLYRRSKARFKQPSKPTYPADALRCRVSPRGRIALDGHQYFVGIGLAGQTVGVRRQNDKLRLLFYELDLGFITSTPQHR